ncbi:MAG TPA: glycosyltransferase family 2 protein [Geobacteraceae bacterium]|nr:glycosyltransferase family 2 protein [Geobacteraceae bacterium]
MNGSVCIIILNWNGHRDTIECVESCLTLDYTPYEIVVVDNGSSDGSEEILKKRFPGIRLLQTGANLGYAGGNNAGIRYALAKGADYVWLLNNDAMADAKALAELVSMAGSDPLTGMVGSKILCHAQPSVLLYAGGRIDFAMGGTEHIGYGCEDRGQFDVAGDTDYITGCSLLVKRRVIEEIGLMNEDYFLYFEETEWCAKAKAEGFRLVYAPASVVLHKESASTGKVKGMILYYVTRNRLYFMGKNGAQKRWLKRFAADLYECCRYIKRKDRVQVLNMLAAYRHWISGYMGPLGGLVKRR